MTQRENCSPPKALHAPPLLDAAARSRPWMGCNGLALTKNSDETSTSFRNRDKCLVIFWTSEQLPRRNEFTNSWHCTLIGISETFRKRMFENQTGDLQDPQECGNEKQHLFGPKRSQFMDNEFLTSGDISTTNLWTVRALLEINARALHGSIGLRQFSKCSPNFKLSIVYLILNSHI